MEEAGAEYACANVVESSKFFTSAIIFSHEVCADRAAEALRAMGFSPASNEFSDFPSKIYERLRGEIDAQVR